jgi:hypothetical protein
MKVRKGRGTTELETIGSIIHPSYGYDLEASLRVHCMLIERSLATQWRFKGAWVTTGPFETLLGYPGCGSSVGGTSWCSLNLYARDGLKGITRTINSRILEALCSYPKLGCLSETMRHQDFRHCGDAVDALAAYERGRTRQRLNSHHKQATLVKDVGLKCTDRGVFVTATVSFNTKPTESSWGLFWLARQKAPRWNERFRLTTWLTKGAGHLEAIANPRS